MQTGLGYLKNLGHQLLDEYIGINHFKGDKQERKEAYYKLAKKLKLEQNLSKAHFGQMNTHKEVLDAINRLERMIRKRRNETIQLGRDKMVIAPNVRELQRLAGELNKDLLLNSSQLTAE